MFPIITLVLLLTPAVAGIGLIFRCLGTLLLNIGCSVLVEVAPFPPERSLLQGGLGLLLLCGAILLRSQLL